jgi:hypothetical protein
MAAVHIIHIDLAGSPDSVVARQKECLLIFWWKDFPVVRHSTTASQGPPLRSEVWLIIASSRPSSSWLSERQNGKV